MSANYVTDPARADLGGNLRHGDVYSFTPTLWTFLIERYAAESVLDVGCGEGHFVKYLRRKGVNVHGIDGLRANIMRAVTPIALHDLLTGPYVMPVDLVWSCEVAEHIVEEKVDHYLDTLTNGRIVAMTHALPGQVGYHHVNCQPPEYWIARMAQRGYGLTPETNHCRALAAKEGYASYFQKSGLVFVRRA
jgi:SAM-dependent methyltransferase